MRKTTVVALLGGLAGLAGVAQADSITQAQLTEGNQVVTGLLADHSATASAYATYPTAGSAAFSHFSAAFVYPGMSGVEAVAGVSSPLPPSDSLINGSEGIGFTFANSMFVDRLDVAFLYTGVAASSGETARFLVTYADNSTGTFAIRPTSLTTAEYTGPATNVQTSDFGLFGAWDITDPFGHSAVKQVVLQAGAWSNFGFQQMSLTSFSEQPVAAAPAPLAVWGGLSLLGAVGAARARKRLLSA